jgi:3-hydroxybutyryl-CoA dehydrogenase
MTTVAVLGFGTMGAGIAQVCAQAGHDVLVLEQSSDLIDAGRSRMEAFLDEGVKRGKVTAEERTQVLSRVQGVLESDKLAAAEVVIESVVEDSSAKQDVLADVSRTVGADALIASNTSALSVTKLARAVEQPGRFLGLHFFNPVPLMPLVEVVSALQTEPATVERAATFVDELGKAPVRVADRPGFLVNSLLMPYLNQAVNELDNGLADPESIDVALRLGLGYPMGPFELLDLIGLDAHHHATAMGYEQTRDRYLAPPPLLQRMVDAGWLGKKSGRGFREGT